MRRLGESDPLRLNWLDPPPAPLLAEARKRLQALDAVDATGAITLNGRAIAALPLPPHLAHMLLCGARAGCAILAAEIALLLQERGLGGQERTSTRGWRAGAPTAASAHRNRANSHSAGRNWQSGRSPIRTLPTFHPPSC